MCLVENNPASGRGYFFETKRLSMNAPHGSVVYSYVSNKYTTETEDGICSIITYKFSCTMIPAIGRGITIL